MHWPCTCIPKCTQTHHKSLCAHSLAISDLAGYRRHAHQHTAGSNLTWQPAHVSRFNWKSGSGGGGLMNTRTHHMSQRTHLVMGHCSPRHPGTNTLAISMIIQMSGHRPNTTTARSRDCPDSGLAGRKVARSEKLSLCFKFLLGGEYGSERRS